MAKKFKINKNQYTFFLNKKKKDKRGSFFKIYDYNIFSKKILKKKIRQVNISENLKKGTIRGLHYQVGKFSEEKIITCLKGSITDYIVDMRKKSKNYLKVFSQKLSYKNQKIILIPKGFAHGYQVLENNTLVMYCHTGDYSKKYEKTVSFFDPKIKLKIKISKKIISKKDKLANLL